MKVTNLPIGNAGKIASAAKIYPAKINLHFIKYGVNLLFTQPSHLAVLFSERRE